MNINEIMENIKLNKKDKKTGIVLIFIASIVAFVTAIYGAFRFGKNKGAQQKKEASFKRKYAQGDSDGRAARKRRKTSDETQAESTSVVYRTVAPQPVYVVRPIEEKKTESRGKRFRRHMCGAASILLVVSLVGSTTLQYTEPATALAKSSFSGIGRIVDDHDDEPYRILDIVPADARYTLNNDSYSFSLGTMGYMVDGQASVVSDLEEGFKENKAYSYDERQKLTDTIINSGTTPGLTYQEAYPGVDTISEAAGWIRIFEETEATGQFYGKFKLEENGDYTWVSGDARGNSGLLNPDATYELHENGGAFRLSFKLMDGSEDMVGGYIATKIGDMSSNSYPYTTCVYEEISPGVYRYVGTIGDLLGKGYDITGGKKQEESQKSEENKPAEPGTADAPSTGGDAPSTGGGDTSTDGGDTSTGGGDTSTGGGDTSTGDGDTSTGGGDTSTGDGDTSTGGGDTSTGGSDTSTGSGETSTGGSDTSTGSGETSTGGSDTSTGGGDTSTGGGETSTGGGDTPADAPAVNNISEPIVRAITLSDGWHLLVEGEEGEDITEDEISNDGGETPVSKDTGDGNTPSSSDTAAPSDGTPSYDETPSYEKHPSSDGSSTKSTEDEWSEEDINWEDYAGFKIVVFEYVAEPWEGAILYKVDGREEIDLADGVPYPYDSYDISYPISTLEADTNLLMVSPDGTTTTADLGFKYTPGTGAYSLVRADKNDADAKLIEVQGVPVYFRCKSDNDWVKEYVFSSLSGGDNESDDFKIEVTTMLASDVRRSDVQDADLIFLESGDSNTVLNMNALSKRYITESYEDMNEDALTEILRSAAEDMKPVIVDYGIVEDEEHYKDSDYQYLAKAFLKSDLEGFYEEMSKDGKLLDNLKTNKNVEDSKEFPNKKENDNHYVNRNVYIINNTSLVSEDFPDEFDRDTARAGFSEVLSAIRAENTTLSDDDQISERVSKARAVQYIINYSVGIIGEFEDLRILEIQPSANLKSDLYQEDDNTKLVWKTEAMTTAKQILSGKKEFNVDIDVRSVVEFNGEWEDINGKYDMVFIGLDGQRLNLDDDGETVYNNSDLDGKVYHSGDNSGSGLGKYDANDLTAQKMEELLEFMAAGYPVVVENNFFEEGSAQDSGKDGINYDYIEEGSVMDHFLQIAVGDYPYYDYIFSVSDVTSSAMFMTQMRISKPRISLVDENGEETSRVQWLTQDNNGEYHGQIYYKIENNRGGDYVGDAVVRVYADYNYDGYFVPSEEVTEFVNDGNMLDIRIDGMGPGILPYKLEVSDAGNEYRRDSVQGYFELGISSEDEMKILQITEKKNDRAVDLQLMFDKVENSMLAGYLHGAETILNTEMQFETVTASQLETRLTENAKYLEQWDVVVLTLDDAAGSSAVAEAINQYVGSGRSLLVCGQDPGDQRAGLSTNLLGQMNDGSEATRTFVNIGGNGASGYLRYDDLDYGMFGGQTLLEAEPVNDGIISFYPYSIDGNITFGETGFLKAAPYLLDFGDNIRSEEDNTAFVTVWYTFSSTDSKGSAYGISPRDARNNYYCYSKGNVVYLAQSEYNYYTSDEQSTPSTEDAGSSECQFFVNALFAAYSAGLHNAHINIVSGFSSDAADIESISVPFDEAWLEAVDDTTGGILDTTVDVFFKFRDNNIASQKTTWVSFYREASAEEGGVMLPVNGEEVKAVPFTSDIWTVTDNRLVQVAENEMQPGKVYRIEAPVITLQNLRGNETENKADIYIVLHTIFMRNGQFYEIITTDAVSLNRARLFRLE